jgi:hypothetical protein
MPFAVAAAATSTESSLAVQCIISPVSPLPSQSVTFSFEDGIVQRSVPHSSLFATQVISAQDLGLVPSTLCDQTLSSPSDYCVTDTDLFAPFSLLSFSFPFTPDADLHQGRLPKPPWSQQDCVNALHDEFSPMLDVRSRFPSSSIQTLSTVALCRSCAGPTGISCSRGLSVPPTTGSSPNIPACPMLLRIAMAVWAAAPRTTEMKEKEQGTHTAAAISATLHRTGIDVFVGRRPLVYSLTDSPGIMTTHLDTKTWVRLTTLNSCNWQKRCQEAMQDQRSGRWHIKAS